MADDLDKPVDDQIPSVGIARVTPKSPSPFIDVDSHGIRRFHGYVVPPEAKRIKVLDIKGKLKLRKIEDLQQGDTPSLNDAGLPVFIEGQHGRPPKDVSAILPPSSPLIGDLLRVKEGHLRNDPILQAAEESPESAEVLNQVVLAIGEEAASLRFERMQAERMGEDTSQLSMRRVAALKAIGDTWIKRKEQIQSRLIDLESPAFQALFQLISETFVRAMQAAGVRQELSEAVVAQFVKLLDDSWKAEAKSRMKE
jgi:hypothetical protein